MKRKVICLTRRLEPSGLMVDLRARDWCLMPYPGHPRGCPNYGHKSTCPPLVQPVHRIFNIHRPMWLIAVEFDLANHMLWMRSRHPDMTDRQARCVLYWQSSVNKQLEEYSREFVKVEQPGTIFTSCPEAMGVQVIKDDIAFASLRCHPEARGKACPGYKRNIKVVYADGAENPIWER